MKKKRKADINEIFSGSVDNEYDDYRRFIYSILKKGIILDFSAYKNQQIIFQSGGNISENLNKVLITLKDHEKIKNSVFAYIQYIDQAVFYLHSINEIKAIGDLDKYLKYFEKYPADQLGDEHVLFIDKDKKWIILVDRSREKDVLTIKYFGK